MFEYIGHSPSKAHIWTSDWTLDLMNENFEIKSNLRKREESKCLENVQAKKKKKIKQRKFNKEFFMEREKE